MAEWANDASEYLDGYLKQVSVLVRKQGDDPREVVAGLRDHILNEVESDGAETVTIDLLLHVLKELGTPEQVANLDLSTPESTATPPPSASSSKNRKNGPFYGSCACCAAAAIVSVLGLAAMIILFLMSFVGFYEVNIEPDASDVPINQQ